jgi:hypothetical protein
MVVVIPETHALDPDQTPRTEVGHYLSENVQAEDRELFEDILPFVTAHQGVHRRLGSIESSVFL